jgi:hypothetical protein
LNPGLKSENFLVLVLLIATSLLYIPNEFGIVSNKIVGVNQQIPIYGMNLAPTLQKYGVNWSREAVDLDGSFGKNIYEPLVSSGTNLVGTLGCSLFYYNSFSVIRWTLDNWSKAVSEAVNWYPKIHVWEIWNEPTGSGNYCGYYQGQPSQYFNLLRSAYRIIKAHNSTDIVLALGGVNVFSSGSVDQENVAWSKQVWNLGASHYSDAVSLHIYTSLTYLLNQTISVNTQTVGQVISSGLDQYWSFTGKQQWITETGIPSNQGTLTGTNLGNSVTKQATFLSQMFTLLESKGYVKAIFWYSSYGLSGPYSYDFGLFYLNTLNPKPALLTLQKFALDGS